MRRKQFRCQRKNRVLIAKVNEQQDNYGFRRLQLSSNLSNNPYRQWIILIVILTNT